MRFMVSCLILIGIVPFISAQENAKQALQPLSFLVGSWRGTGSPSGTLEEKQKGFWVETISWEWQFKDKDAWLKANFEKGKYFQSAELRFDPATKQYRFTATTSAKDQHQFQGTLQDKILTLDRDTGTGVQRIVFSLLHSNRYLYRLEEKPTGKVVFQKRYTVGATKEGEPFAVGTGQPECIVSGGLGTSTVSFQGKTYYVCCSGCRTEFYENPAMYVAEYEKKRKKER